jgi:excisionase family DNA binding protein
MRKKEPKMLTVKEVASQMGQTGQTIRTWLKRGRFPGARLEETPLGSYWLIPDTAVEGFELKKAGRPPKPKTESAKKAKAK